MTICKENCNDTGANHVYYQQYVPDGGDYRLEYVCAKCGYKMGEPIRKANEFFGYESEVENAEI